MAAPMLTVQERLSDGFGGVLKGARTFARDIKEAWKPHAVLQLCGVGLFISGYLASLITGYLLPASPEGFVFKFVFVAAFYVLAALLAVKCVKMIAFERPQHPAAEIVRWFWSFLGDSKRLANGFHGMVFVFLLMGGFTMWKNQVARIFAFAWDPTLEHLDRWLHFGYLPHEWLQPVLGYPLITAMINWNYLVWFHVLFVSMFVAAFQPQRSFVRQRFFFAVFLGWTIGGIMLANLLSSAGPVFYERVTGNPAPYAGLFHYLHSVDQKFTLTTLQLQDFLWSAYQATPSYSTISAMPSMHVTIALLVFLAARSLGRLAAWISGIFAALIIIGSIHLGWHYGVDGYLGIAVALVSWTLAAPLARWDLRRGASPTPATAG